MWANRSQKVAVRLASSLTSPVRVKAWVPWEDGHHENSKMIVLWYVDIFENIVSVFWGFPGGLVVKNLPANAGDVRDMGSTPGSRRSPGEGYGNLL